MALTQRFGDFQPFARSTERADGRQAGLETGFLTYSRADGAASETYQVSSFEVAGRSDHIADPLCALFNVEQVELSSDAPLSSDVDLIRQRTQKQNSTEAAV